MESNLVDIIKSIVEQINTNLPVLSIDGEKIYLCNTLHLTIGKTIKDATDKEYKIKEFKINEYIVVEPFGHTDPFTGAVVVAPNLTFLHGDPKSTNNEYLQKAPRTSAKTPFIWLVESYSAENIRRDSAVDLSFNARIFLLDWANTPEWTNTEHNDNVIKPMENLLRVFLQVIDDDYNFKRLDTPRIAVRTRFGDPIGDPANLIINEDLSGIDVSFNLEVYDAGLCCTTPIEPVDDCVPATNTLNGNPIEGTLPNTNKAITIVDNNGATINPTILNDSKTSLDLEIVGGLTNIAYNRENWRNRPIQYFTHDLAWYRSNTNYFDYNAQGLKVVLDKTDETKLINLNFWGNLNRATNDLGGNVFDGSDGSTPNYLVDNFTGLGWYLNEAVGASVSWENSAIAIQTFNAEGFNDWRMPNAYDIRQIIYTDGTTSILTGHENFIKSIFWIMDSVSSVSATIWRQSNQYQNATQLGAFSKSSGNVSITAIVCRNHFN